MPVESPKTRLTALSPSAKLVAKALEHHGAMIQRQLAEPSQLHKLSQRTLRDALDRLDEGDLVTAKVSFRDARQQHYAPIDNFSE